MEQPKQKVLKSEGQKVNNDYFPEKTVDFIGFSDDKNHISRVDIEGQDLWGKIFSRDLNFGGMLVGIFGMMGSGKTSLLHHITRRIMKENPDELIFWREPMNNPLQVINSGCDFQVFCEKNHPVCAQQLSGNQLRYIDTIKIRKFSGFYNLLKMADKDKINVVYLNDHTRWLKLIERLKIYPGFKTLIMDEMEDIVPMRVSGKSWQMNERFANSLKEIRKCNINLVYNTQNQFDLDYRISSKTMMHIYCYGARKDEHSPVFKGALQNLSLGSAWIDLARARFGMIRFPPVKPKQPLYYIVDDNRRRNKQ
jgi:hypothetical protein